MPKLLGLKFNVTNIYTIQNTTLLTRCMRKLLDVNSHSLLTAKVYFLIKWTDMSIGYKQTAILKFLYLNLVLWDNCSSSSLTRVWFGAGFVSYSLPRRKHARAIVILIRVSCHLFSGKRQISGAVSNRLPITLL